MNVKDFLGKFVSRYLLLNLLAMLLVVVALCVGVAVGLNAYTRHGEGIEVPNLYGMDYKEAIILLDQDQLFIVANDTGYNKRMPANSILTQTPGAGVRVKQGRTIYVAVNSASSPSVALPDLIDNSSYREAQARLQAMGFRLLPPKRIDGERDWVYDIRSAGRSLQAGDMVPIESPLTLVIGNGFFEDNDDEDLLSTTPAYGRYGEQDEFEEIAPHD